MKLSMPDPQRNIFWLLDPDNQEEEKAYKITAPVTFFAISAQAFSNQLKSEDYWGKEG